MLLHSTLWPDSEAAESLREAGDTSPDSHTHCLERERDREREGEYWHFFNLILRRYIELKGPKMSKSFLVNFDFPMLGTM